MSTTIPDTIPDLQALVKRQQAIIASFEEGKRLRQQQEAEAATSPAADFALEAFGAKADLESLADGAEDYRDPRTRLRITGRAIKLIDRMLAAMGTQPGAKP